MKLKNFDEWRKVSESADYSGHDQLNEFKFIKKFWNALTDMLSDKFNNKVTEFTTKINSKETTAEDYRKQLIEFIDEIAQDKLADLKYIDDDEPSSNVAIAIIMEEFILQTRAMLLSARIPFEDLVESDYSEFDFIEYDDIYENEGDTPSSNNDKDKTSFLYDFIESFNEPLGNLKDKLKKLKVTPSKEKLEKWKAYLAPYIKGGWNKIKDIKSFAEEKGKAGYQKGKEFIEKKKAEREERKQEILDDKRFKERMSRQRKLSFSQLMLEQDEEKFLTEIKDWILSNIYTTERAKNLILKISKTFKKKIDDLKEGRLKKILDDARSGSISSKSALSKKGDYEKVETKDGKEQFLDKAIADMDNLEILKKKNPDGSYNLSIKGINL